MEWTQTIALGTAIIAYMTGISIFLYRLNERSTDRAENRFTNVIKEWRDEHKNQMQEWREEHKSQLEKNEAHWREMFKYMNSRIDISKNQK
jgi:hypothetical protein